eukprot:8059207-Ditylum_brightwellii.AAC.1
MLSVTIQCVNKYMLTTELDVLLDNDTVETYDYDNNLTEDTATITVYTTDHFFIPIHIEAIIQDEWCEDQKHITIDRPSS